MTVVRFISIQILILDLMPAPQTRILCYPENFRALIRLHWLILLLLLLLLEISDHQVWHHPLLQKIVSEPSDLCAWIVTGLLLITGCNFIPDIFLPFTTICSISIDAKSGHLYVYVGLISIAYIWIVLFINC